MRELFSHISITSWSEISVTLFTALFVVMLFWVYSPRQRGSYDRAEKLPLEKD